MLEMVLILLTCIRVTCVLEMRRKKLKLLSRKSILYNHHVNW